MLMMLLAMCTAVWAEDTVVKVNFCAGNVTTSNAGWNNFSNYTSTTEAAKALKDINGQSTSMALSLAATFNGTNTEGVQTTTTSLNMTSKESYSAFWSQAAGSSAKASGAFTLSGLDPDLEYDFTIFGSRKSVTDNRETVYAFSGSNSLSATLNCSSNASNVATVTGVKCDLMGKITITLTPGSKNNNSNKYYYINALQITQRGESSGETIPAIKILTIGNSFSEDAVEQNLYELAAEAGIRVVIGNAYRGGQGLKSHWDDVVNGNNTFEYRKVVNGVRTNTKDQALSTIVKDEDWDFVTFQQVSQESGMASTFEPYLGNLIDYVRTMATNPAVKYGYHMTWAYAQSSTHSGYVNYSNDQLAMYEAICSAVQTAVQNHSELSFVVPTGTAVQNARTSYIGDNMNRDGYHLNYGIGRYTAACTWLETVLGENPIGHKFRPTSVDETTAQVGQKAAHEAVLNPYKITNLSNEGYDGDNTIVPAAIKINFGNSPTSNTAWNNVTSSNTLVAGLKDVNGDDTQMVVMLNDAFNDTNTSGVSSTTTPLDMPSEVAKSCFWGYNLGEFGGQAKQPTGGFAFSHMNKSLAYDFTFFASRASSSDNRETAFLLSGQDSRTGYLDAASNGTNTVTVKNVVPNDNGIITLTVSPGENNTNVNKFYYINAVMITAHEPMSDDYVREISTPDQLRSMINAYPMGDFVLTSDLDMTGIKFAGIASFSGTLDGQGHVIKGMTINDASATSNGLFHTATGATVRRLTFVDANVNGGDNTGILAGIFNGGLVEQVAVLNSTVEGGDRISPIVGRGAAGLTVKDCMVQGTSVKARTHQAAGIVAASFDGGVAISNCYFQGDISSQYGYVASILGLNDRDGAVSVKNCLNVATSIKGGNRTRIAHWGSRKTQSTFTNNWSISTTESNGSWISTDERQGTMLSDDKLAGDKDFYATTLGWDMEGVWKFVGAGQLPVLQTVETALGEQVSISKAGYATMVANNELDFTNSGVKAYTVKISGEYAILTATNLVSAGAAVVITGAQGEHTIPFAPVYAPALTDNQLQAATAPTVADGTQYILGNMDGQTGFYQATEGTTIAAGKGYLLINGAAVKAFFFDDNATAINGVTTDNGQQTTEIFNLSGQRASKLQKGVNIVKGKKYLK